MFHRGSVRAILKYANSAKCSHKTGQQLSTLGKKSESTVLGDPLIMQIHLPFAELMPASIVQFRELCQLVSSSMAIGSVPSPNTLIPHLKADVTLRTKPCQRACLAQHTIHCTIRRLNTISSSASEPERALPARRQESLLRCLGALVQLSRAGRVRKNIQQSRR